MSCIPWMIGRVSRNGAWHIVRDHRTSRLENSSSWVSACGRFNGSYDRADPIALQRPHPIFNAHKARVCGFCLHAEQNRLDEFQRTMDVLKELDR